MDLSIPIFIVLLVIAVAALIIGFAIKGKDKVFGQELQTSRQTWARFWITAGWTVLLLSVVYFIFGIILHLYLRLY
ncbi:hypothetical protein NR996_00315 [Lactobacillus rodentium]|uniref:Uncharacterized protein n=1 Tax=Lactobacillus rodentium TaxID=947835 RepID=A0A2Z6TDU0_9LACO|nr:hypothetical protein [Lactobacillus rodentium]MCR1893854.1 hypothetical protein [Lactobacillus rodentium]GBG04280.1 hypothetical protein LrDSM24759_01940 [Lactobacillus rodentium]